MKETPHEASATCAMWGGMSMNNLAPVAAVFSLMLWTSQIV